MHWGAHRHPSIASRIARIEFFWKSPGDGIRQWADYVNLYIAKGCRKTEAKPKASGEDMVTDQRPFIRSGYHPTCCPCP